LLVAAQRRGWQIAGSEISAVAARRASEELGVAIFNGDFRAAGFAPASFDVVTLSFVVEHVRDPMAMLQAAVELLAPGGVLFVCVPSPASWEFAAARLTGQLWRGFIIEHLSYFSPAFMRTLIGALGLELVKLNCWSPEITLPNPLRDLMGMVKPSPVQQSANERTPHEASLQATTGEIAIPPLPPVSLARRIVRQVNNYALDTLSALSAYTPASGNAIYVWARKG
jgi:SAM-dependent methyltransferase